MNRRRFPSEALRLARKQSLVVMNRDQPEAVLFHLDDDKLLGSPVYASLSHWRYTKIESRSVGKAAKLANMPVAEFMQYASRHGIATIRGTVRSAQEDAKTLDAWLKKRSSWAMRAPCSDSIRF